MFRALLLFPPGTDKVLMEAPMAITLLTGKDAPAVELAVQSEAIFTTAVGHSSKRTLASWHVTTPQEIVEHMLVLVKDISSSSSTSATEHEDNAAVAGGKEKANL